MSMALINQLSSLDQEHALALAEFVLEGGLKKAQLALAGVIAHASFAAYQPVDAAIWERRLSAGCKKGVTVRHYTTRSGVPVDGGALLRDVYCFLVTVRTPVGPLSDKVRFSGPTYVNLVEAPPIMFSGLADG